MHRSAFLCFMLAASPAWGDVPASPGPRPVPTPVTDGPIVRMPSAIQGTAGDLIELKVESGAELVTWDASPGVRLAFPKPFDPAQKTVFVHAAKDGTYAVIASIPHGKETRVAICLITIGPRPPPTPTPLPVDPIIPAGEFRVLFVYESSTLTPKQSNVMQAKAVSDYLRAKCAKGADGTPEYRRYDKDVSLGNESSTWQQIWNDAKPTFTGLPIVVIINGQKGQTFPLPATADELLTLLKKHGG